MPRRAWRTAVAGIGVALLLAAIVVGPSLARSAWRSFERSSEARTADPAQRLTSLSGNRRDMWALSIDLAERHPRAASGPGRSSSPGIRIARRSESRGRRALALPGVVRRARDAGRTAGPAARCRRAAHGGAAGTAARASTGRRGRPQRAPRPRSWSSASPRGSTGCGSPPPCARSALVLGTVARRRRGARRARVRWPLRVGLTVAAVAAILVQLPLFAAASAIRSSQQAVGPGTVRRRASRRHRRGRVRDLGRKRLPAASPGARAGGAAGAGRGRRAARNRARADELAAVAGPRPHPGRAGPRRARPRGGRPGSVAQPALAAVSAGRGACAASGPAGLSGQDPRRPLRERRQRRAQEDGPLRERLWPRPPG